jgi:putative ABC transport system permease protein
MRALGNRSRQIFLLIVLENVLLGVIGGAIGVVVGVVLAYTISAVGIQMPPPPNSDIGYVAQIRIVPSVVIGSFLVGLLATVLASIAPAFRVARGSVVDALRQNV